VFDAGALQLPFLMIAVYLPGWLTVIVSPVSPSITTPFLNHSYEVPPVAVSTCDPSAQITDEAGLTVPEIVPHDMLMRQI
jgi:hypothetical protein